MSENSLTRRGFLRVAAGAAALAATGAACGSGSDKPKSSGAKDGASKGGRTLRIAQWSHLIPSYDEWFDAEYTKRWGEQNDMEVVVDHIPLAEITPRAAAEAAAKRGHDLFAFIAPPSAFEDDAIDHREVVEEVRAKLGTMTPLAERSVYNPKTNKWFAFPDSWSPNPVNYRSDLWAAVGAVPDTWDHILVAGPKLKAMGHPLGLDVSQDLDANMNLLALMHAYGSSIQDEEGRVVINRRATVEAVKVGSAIFRTGMTDEVLSWDNPASNNRYLASDRGSLIVNPVSGLRAVEKQDPELATRVALAPSPAGPVARLGVHSVMGAYVIWRFAQNQEAAKRFLVDLVLNYRQAFVHSEYYNVPAFPASVPGFDELVAADPKTQPPDKYALLAEAVSWSTNLGHPGHANAAIDEVFNQYVVPKMFAAAARGEMTAEEAVNAAEAQITPIFDKWLERGRI